MEGTYHGAILNIMEDLLLRTHGVCKIWRIVSLDEIYRGIQLFKVI